MDCKYERIWHFDCEEQSQLLTLNGSSSNVLELVFWGIFLKLDALIHNNNKRMSLKTNIGYETRLKFNYGEKKQVE